MALPVSVNALLLSFVASFISWLKCLDAQPERYLFLVHNLTQDDLICGETVSDKMYVELSTEPGTKKRVKIDFLPSERWVRLLVGNIVDEQIINSYEWKEYVKEDDLRVSISIQLLVPGCLPAKPFSIPMTGKYKGDMCDNVECYLGLPDETFEFTTALPRQGELNIQDFVVIPGQWSHTPIRLTIPYPLLPPEILEVTPKSLLDGAVIFSGKYAEHMSPHLADQQIQFSWSRTVFGTMANMYVYGRKDLAPGSKLQIQFYQKCDECTYNTFFKDLKQPMEVTVGFESMQRFIPIYMPTMQTMHKYCYHMMLSKAPMIDVTVIAQVACSGFKVEPKEIRFRSTGDDEEALKSQKFCVSPFVPDESCELEFFLTGDGAFAYHTPHPIQMYSVAYKEAQANPLKRFHFEPIIEVTNRKQSNLIRFSWDISETVDVELTPLDVHNGFFTFTPAKFFISHAKSKNMIEFAVYANVDCPLRHEDSNLSVYWVVDFNVTSGSIREYVKPHPLYIKVIENHRETEPRMGWCSDRGFDCESLPNGMTCITDVCAIDYQNKACKPSFIGYPPEPWGIREYAIGGSVALVLLYVILRQLGCVGPPKIPEVDDEQEIEEKKIFNTSENLREAQVAIENLLWQIHRYEQNLDIGKKYERDVLKNDDYWDE